jgi:hypothetical protein
MKKILAIALIFAASATAKAQDYTIWGDHEDTPYGATLGYVSKEWSTDFDGDIYSENMWGEEGKRFHGVQIGIFYNPCYKWGGGIYTGLFYEGYISMSRKMGYDKFYEHGCYLPIHLSFRLPFGSRTSLTLRGGFGFNVAFYGEFRYFGYEDRNGHYYGPKDYLFEYGREGWPKRFNAQAEMALSFRHKSLQLTASYSRGLTDHAFYRKDGPYKTYQNKFGISIGFVLPE